MFYEAFLISRHDENVTGLEIACAVILDIQNSIAKYPELQFFTLGPKTSNFKYLD
jgi:hypothetical protein